MSSSSVFNQTKYGEQESYNRFIDSLNDGFELLRTLTDEQGKIIDFVFLKVNHAFEIQTGLRGVDLVGKRKKQVAPAAEERWYDYAIEASKTSKTLSYEYFNPEVNRLFETQFIPILPNQIVVLFRDITERKKTEDELREMQYRLTIAKDAAKLGIYDYYISSGRVYWDKSVRDIWGIPENEAVTFEMFLSAIYPEDRKIIDWSVFSPENNTFNVDYRVVNKQQGAIRWVKATGTFFFQDAQPVRLIGTIEDITDRKNMEKKIKDQERLSVIGATAGMVGHDIRNPLQAMTSDIFLLKEEIASTCVCKNKADLTESLVSLDENISYINKIVQDLTDYARPLAPEYSIVSLSNVFVRVFENVRISESIKLSIKVEEIEELRTDPMLLQRALSNLVANALQAMPEGGTLEITGHREENQAVITVSDTGVGIPDEIKGKLFIPMMTTKAKGQGFGLAVSKRLIEAMKGTISFESEEGKGTKFIIELPITI
jgi:two-component system sensor kinase FixL